MADGKTRRGDGCEATVASLTTNYLCGARARRFCHRPWLRRLHLDGVIQAAYDYCPTGNEADLGTGPLGTTALGNPVRQGGVPYDDGTKDFVSPSGGITEDYNGVCTQGAGLAFGDVILNRSVV